jgi:hypothetical protein
VIGEASCLYRREKDGMEIVVKVFDISEFEAADIDREMENLSNLRHPLIAAPIELTIAFLEGKGELEIGRLSAAGGSLAKVVLSNPVWWTPTPKARAAVGIALALRFEDCLGLLHGALKADNAIFDGEGRLRLTDFRPMRWGGGFSGKRWSPRPDISAFGMLRFDIVAGRPWFSGSDAKECMVGIRSLDVPAFALE